MLLYMSCAVFDNSGGTIPTAGSKDQCQFAPGQKSISARPGCLTQG